ncbi:MAG: chaperone NapD [Desulforhopalus sp.]
MPISGVVITSRPSEKQEVLRSLAQLDEVEVYGDDEKGNIVAVLETLTSEEMERTIDRINKDENVLHVGLTYLNTEDEADRMAKGEKLAKPFGFRKPLIEKS